MSEIKNIFKIFLKSLLKLKEPDQIAGFKDYWANKIAAFGDLFDNNFENYLSSVGLVDMGYLEEGCIGLSCIYDGSEFKSESVLMAQDILSRIQCWESLNGSLSSLKDDRSLSMKRLSIWVPESREHVEQTPDEFSTECFSRIIDSLSVTYLESLVVKKTDLSPDMLDLPQKMASINIVNPLVTISEKLLGIQAIINAGEHQTSIQKKGNIRIRKAKPKDRITEDLLTFERLIDWVQTYDILSYIDSTRAIRDPDVDEIGGLLSNLARKSRNLTLAKRLNNSSVSSLSKSSKLRASFMKARILWIDESNHIEASNLLLDVLSMQAGSTELIDLELQAKSCSLLCEWNNLLASDFFKNPKLMTALDRKMNDASNARDLPLCFMKRATELAPHLSKSWFKYAGYCYDFGRKMIEDIGKIPKARSLYFPVESDIILNIPEFVTNKDLLESYIYGIFESIGENRGGAKSSLWRLQVSEDSIEKLEVCLKDISTIILEQFKAACNAYFTFLEVQRRQQMVLKSSIQSEEITATIRILRLFVRYSNSFDGLFEEKFQSSPIYSWINVIPQLFSRIHSEDITVRNQLCSLLCRIGLKYPHLILYSVLSSSSENADEPLGETMNSLLYALMNEHGTLVHELNRWIIELQSITVLWGELWITGLEKAKADIHERILKLKKDSDRISSNTSLDVTEQQELIKNTTSSIFKPVLYQFEMLLCDTIKKDATCVYQEEFIEKYGERLTEAVLEFTDRTEFSNLENVFNIFEKVVFYCPLII